MTLWQKIKIIVVLQIAVIISYSATHTIAEELLRNPSSIDPILRNVPLEKERVRPDPTPGLNIPPIRGKQTIVLHVAQKKSEVVHSPSFVLRIPSEHFSRIDDEPIEVFGINLLIRFPSMTRYIEPIESCHGWCSGKIRMSLEARGKGSISSAAGRAIVVAEDLARLQTGQDPIISRTSLVPPPDYDQAFDIVYNKRADAGRYKRYFVKNDDRGTTIEFVECLLKVPSPSCEFLISFPEQPAIQISYMNSADMWSARREIQSSIIALVRSFYDRAIMK